MSIKILIIILIIICALLSYFYRKDFRSPSLIYSLYWLVILGMNLLGLFGIFATGNRPYIYIALGCVAFLLGSLGNRIIGIGNSHRSTNENIYFDEVILNILFAVSFIFFLRKNILFIEKLIEGYSFHSVRYENLISSTYLEDVVIKFIARPFSAAIMCIGCTELIIEKKSAKQHCMKGIILIIQSMLFDGGLVVFQFLVVSLTMTLLFLFEQNNRIKKESRSVKAKNESFRVILILFGVVFVGLFFAKGNFLKSIYMHIAPSINYLEERIQNIDAGRECNSAVMQYTYGFTTLQGILRPLMAIFERIGIESEWFNSATNFLLDNQDHVINIGVGERFNYFATSYAFYYKDFGIWGILFFPFLHGVVSNQLYLQIKSKMNMHNLALYIFVVGGILLTAEVALFSYTEIIVGVYWLLLSERRRKQVGERNEFG